MPTNGREKTGYPTQKPEGIVRRMVQASSSPGDWCLDCFAGSGTLGAVAAALGRRYVLDRLQPRGRSGHVRRGWASLAGVYHVELRKFPHTACAFNLSEAELQQLVGPWSRAQWVELGERKWNPNEARLTVLEGPHLPVEELAMGRGWGNAQHQSEDVTERVLDAGPAAGRASRTSPIRRRLPALMSCSLLGADPDALLRDLAPGRQSAAPSSPERVPRPGRTDAAFAGSPEPPPARR